MPSPRTKKSLPARPLPVRVIQRLKRSALRFFHFNWIEGFESLRQLIHFLRQQPDEKTILLVEPNEFHAETLPGYWFYLNQLNFKVVILARHRNSKSGAFNRLPESERPKTYQMGLWSMKCCLKSRHIKEYDFVFITSNVLAERHGYFGLFFDYLGFIPIGKSGYLVIEHNYPSLKESRRAKRIETDRVFLLSEYSDGGTTIPMLNPNYFGPLIARPKEQKDTITFITVGSLTSRNRNTTLLNNAVQQLENAGVLNFKVLVVGKCLEPSMLLSHSSRIKFLGFLNFEDLFSSLERSDFYLTLLDPENTGHRRYLDGETTGSRQLILGFNLLPVINRVFADAYAFNDSNAVVYEDDDLACAMLQAIRMHPDETRKRREGLAGLTEKIRKQSLFNLRERIGTLGETRERTGKYAGPIA